MRTWFDSGPSRTSGPRAAAAAAGLSPEQLRSLESGDEVTLPAGGGATWTFLPLDIVVEREVATDWPVETDGPFVVAVDTTLTEELEREGLAREVVNRIQRMRKDAGYEFTTRIALGIVGANGVVAALTSHADFIKEETLTRELLLGSRLPAADLEQEMDIDGHPLTIGVGRYDS